MNLEEFLNKQKQSQAYNEFKEIENEINLYRNKIQPMTDEQGNNFRHMAGSAAYSQKHNPILTNIYGFGKEVEDFFVKKKSLADSVGDIRNNLYGSLIGTTVKAMPRRTLYDLIFDKQIKNKY